MVIASAPMGEYDRRVVLLTRQMGKISCFAHGARRPGSPLMAQTDLFAFGEFRLIAGRSAYTLASAEISNYFPFFRTHITEALYASYMIEVMGYITRENNDEAQLLLLLYQSLRALESEHYDNRLVRSIFELKTVVIEGEYAPEQGKLPEAARYALEHIVSAPVSKLYTFALEEEARKALEAAADRAMWRAFHHEFAALAVIQAMSSE